MNFDNGILKSYEKKFNDNVSLKFTELLLKEIIALFDRLKPEVVIYGGYDTAPYSSLLTYLVAKSKGIELIVPQHMRLLPQTHLSNTIFNHWPQLDDDFEITTENRKAANEFSQKLNEGHKVYDTNKEFLTNKKPFLRRLKSFYYVIKGNLDKGLKKELYNNHNPIIHFYNNEFYKYREYQALKKLNIFEASIPDFRYAYFPLHIEPEMSTLLYAPHYKNQVEIVSQVARSLPVNIKLVVKDHAGWLSRRNRDFYKKLKSLNNVILIDPTIDSRTLIKNCEFLVAITGTAAFEASIMDKKVISFGKSFFTEHLSNIISVRNFEDLPYICNKITQDNYNTGNNAIDILAKVIQLSELPELGLTTRKYNSELCHDIFKQYAAKIESMIQ